MRHLISAALLALAIAPALAEEDIVLRGMGSFHIGGRIAEVSGKAVRMILRQPGGPQSKLDRTASTWSSRCTCSISCRRTARANTHC